MNFWFALQPILLFSIAALALFALIFRSPVLNACLLALQTTCIGIYFILTEKITYNNASLLILLTFFCLIILSSNLYIEKSTQTAVTTNPKLSAITGTFLLVFFYMKLSLIEPETIIDIKINYSFFGQDIMAIIGAVFTIFAMLISALAVINTKNIE